MMRQALLAVLALGTAPAIAGITEGGVRVPSGEVFVYPAEMQAALLPLRDAAREAVRTGRCPGLRVLPDGTLHEYAAEARFGVQNRRTGVQKVMEVRLTDPSGCEPLDAEIARLLGPAVQRFAEPREMQVGWVRLPRVRVTVGD
jgi:hypothetical protein